MAISTIYIVFDKLPKKNGGGLATAYINLVEELQSYYQIKFVCIFDNGKNDIPEFENIPLYILSKKNIDNRFFTAFNYLKQGKFKTFFHAIASGLFFFGSLPINRLRSKKLLKNQIIIASSPAAAMFLSKQLQYILEIHTSFDYFWGNNILGRTQSALIPPPEMTLFRTKHDAEKAQRLFPSSYIYNAFNTKNIPSVDLEKPLTHSALFVGRLAPEKNPLKLLDCAKLVKEIIPDFTLDIYGDGPLFNTLLERIEHMELQNNVHLKGFIDDKAIYQNYDLLWVTSTLEGFGLVIIEAMANGIPCVSTNWGEAASEIIAQGKTGYIVESNEEFAERSIQLLSNKNKRKNMAKNALEVFYNNFTCKINTQHWIELLKKIYP